jgi:hypothetical protein
VNDNLIDVLDNASAITRVGGSRSSDVVFVAELDIAEIP